MYQLAAVRRHRQAIKQASVLKTKAEVSDRQHITIISEFSDIDIDSSTESLLNHTRCTRGREVNGVGAGFARD